MASEKIVEFQGTDELLRWFVRRLDELEISVDDEELTYECQSDYDFLFYRLQGDAERFWERNFGYRPTPGQLTKAFFGAEYERARRDRLARRSWAAKLGDFFSKKQRPAARW